MDLAKKYSSNEEFSDERFMLPQELLDWFINNTVANKNDLSSPKISPLNTKNLTRMPKCLIVGAELDPLIDQSIAYHHKLVSNSAECSLKIVKGAIHSFFREGFYQKNAFSEACQHICEFFKQI